MKKEYKQKYVVIDCETAGLNATENPITEVAMLAMEKADFSEISRWETLVKPYANLKIEKEALTRTGITMSMLNTGKPVEKVVETMIKFFQSVTPKGDKGAHRPILVGQNVGFDIRFIKFMFELVNEQLFDYVHSSTEEREGKPPREGDITRIDTMVLAREIWGEEERMTLSFIAKRCGISFNDAHRAMNDVVATAQVLEWMMKRLRSEKKERNTVIEVSGTTTPKDVEKFHKTFEF